MKKVYIVILIISAYISLQIFSDITSLKIILLASFSLDAGTLVYPLTFTLRDLVHKTLGIEAARLLIFTAAGINIFMALLFALVAALPADPAVGPQTEFTAVLSPVWRIVFASIVAEVVSELVDTEAYHMWVKKVGKNYQWGRVLFSNSVSVPLDSALFVTLAFLGTMPVAVVWSIFLANVLIKGATTLISIPLIYGVPDEKVATVSYSHS